MIRNLLAAATFAAGLGVAALPAGAQTPSPAGQPTAGGQPVTPMPRPGQNSVVTPDASASVPTTRNTTGATPSDTSNSASARGGSGTGPVPGTNTNR
ncbi:hypothetical protein LPC08_22615 [Roseomonas sp. OT10]|uniref:hypothetical protein n=1 Tax=Roseomonas cutis TaxID=2897332 RepID=UPI001E28C02B|nr:hypothetical protein [Roseomonas sp. OT10]UFN48761.1 hypothetical protein LPC08_22615 [Roseomonas sp. OT10]